MNLMAFLLLARWLHYFPTERRPQMQLLQKVTLDAGSLEIAQETPGALQNEGKWFILWAGVWIIALAVLLPALI